ncbi:bifunctional 3-(3-hydroxy-phenyl)propionate/3-hydroxycinnamic acid hydroxylase [Gordonia hongkongensis]|uniref:Bifunctional 3-(3-hydroxy-phenyl)propionate/3-hydroxycinnamic acid hydroxylase n=1 Tax=Gordonia hongkongensis TaxID=1701090 RepID=A0AAX3T5J3_9ACTN|nr:MULTISPECIES: bifunctional 3-(3-hydroxy-phenyl)propionate/3-hydroxycinnamic acid hydroxylase [Gordonia]MBR7194099.1 bifunctional 3-(3-hydroxy-phenyl)propionate/3-hydroxycinnamic acid hydroxylase [Gordonia sp. SCSIO 19800]MCX2753746.1 bifunctional 3-(3-hydroxy-phenyl)propionate/3-hydroxycinnamic acid hydroxylase [Gordonia sp. 4N]QIK46544.1 bifunctional 3-(3-hydroxy-phenyl)propionate/3-hydroxycinnamic acid hydroxylase [Gordonia terrae]WFP24459.1 bifunctional 3-(3-hydroxy-phenyl)propionate/3-hy
MSPCSDPVVIVGAGPTGLTAAALLADLGVRSIVVERWDGVYPQPRAVHLDDEVYRIIARLGLGPEFAAISRPALGLRLVTSSLHVLAEFPRDPGSGPHGFPAASMFDQPRLEELLRAAVARRSSMITVRSGVEVEGIDQSDTGVTLTGRDRQTGEPIVPVSGGYLLGCDGAASVTRSAISAEWRDLGFSQRWLVVDIETSADLRQWEGVTQVCDAHRAATYMRIGDTRYRWEFQLLWHESAADYSTIDGVRPLLQPWLNGVDVSDLTLIRSAEYTFRARIARRWRDRRVFLLGDAAHLTPPFIGQGMGAGIRDAANLSWKLAAVLSGGASSSTLDSYEQERIPHVTGLIRIATATGAAMTGGGRAGDMIRRIVAPVLARAPRLTRRLTDSSTAPLRHSWYVRTGAAGGCLPRWARLDTAANPAGMLMPNAITTGDGRRLDDRRPGFEIVAVDAPTPEQAFEIERRGGSTLVVSDDHPLRRWLLDHHVHAAIVRPDATVMAAGKSIAAVYTLLPALAAHADAP